MITIGIIAVMFTLLCGVTELVENAAAIGHWLWDAQTAYYKFKHFRKRRYYR